MKNSKQLLMLTLFLLLFSTNSCKKNEVISDLNSNTNKNLSLEEARTHFEKKFAISSTGFNKIASTEITIHQHDENSTVIMSKKPMWDGFKYKELLSGYQAVLVPIHKEGEYLEVSEGKFVKYGFLNYLMMYKDSSNTILTEWVQLKPSLQWIDSKISRKYDGDIIIKDWQGTVKKIFKFRNGEKVDYRSPSNLDKQATLKRKMATLPPNQSYICTTTKTLTFKPGSNCLCENHTWAERGQCTCPYTMPGVAGNYPKPSVTTIHTSVDCVPLDEEEPAGGGPPKGGGNQGENGGSGGSGGNSGGSSPEDYPPGACNPDPNYTVPTVPPPAGQSYQIPCSEIELPVEDIPSSGSAGELLISAFTLNGYSVPTISPLSDEENQVLIDFIFQRGDNEDLIEIAYWAMNKLSSNSITLGQFENWFTGESSYNSKYVLWAINEMKENNSNDVFSYFSNKHIDYIDDGEGSIIHDDGNYDTSVAPTINILQQITWPTILPIIPIDKFVRFDGSNCYTLAKKQIELMGYTTSDYYAHDAYGEKQTINIFKKPNDDFYTEGEVNFTELQRGINYLHHALKRNIPIVVGVDYGATNTANNDNKTTDHFIVIVGMGNDSNGNFFQYYDSGSNLISQGTHNTNKLYYNHITGKVEGKGVLQREGANGNENVHYIITMIRKSKTKK
ncbi:hypothetical protein HMPREF0765_4719 [Sphingobacterium spiritivorum ATCC 33300]|uniref:Peptidase C39-like domain-containing protein n=1 Tax=Sphingobacterium spiritivorum ATCC 33300 TaxID=525372 RepID=C2G563_SPHSI|nr:hypothetical protein [Sphingobacterium spiritivorum]EEI89814.1 hypothetical protein HMPREF0765_4719 [Sphingobacterium spiritivorum ATCC 33300]QQS94672.1 hypothetical protein I6J03_14915 [Sphingobacterium spiritivorum]